MANDGKGQERGTLPFKMVYHHTNLPFQSANLAALEHVTSCNVEDFLRDLPIITFIRCTS